MNRITLALTFALAPLAHAQHWKVQYFYDELNKTFLIEDLAFPSAQRGVAVGTILEEGSDSKGKYAAMLTSDGGEHWTMEPLKEHPRSIFFLDDSTGWLVTDEGIWTTEESGRNWKKVGEQKKPNKKLGRTPPGGLIMRVWFLDRQHGFAVGLQKSMFETHDGGRTWTAVEEAAKPSADAGHAVYTEILFTNKQYGLAVGSSNPARPDDPRLPSWMEPERALRRRQVPTLTFMIETRDGGAKWTVSTAPLFGNIVSLKIHDLLGLAVFSFNEAFEWPSEVYRLDLNTGVSKSVYREKDRRVTDCALFAGRAYLAAVEPPGKLNSVPIPGKVRMLTSTDLEHWTEMDVDYKAVARSLVLAGPDAEHQWAATDTGMILHLVQ